MKSAKVEVKMSLDRIQTDCNFNLNITKRAIPTQMTTAWQRMESRCHAIETLGLESRWKIPVRLIFAEAF